ncbi:carboxypeptidase regulatory-like domain-containing protein [bacterium]|nr:carboxypeptidase regulatory-like domain-containing protein [bacterium]
MKGSKTLAAAMCLAAVSFLWLMSTSLLALIMVSSGNRPVENMGWPLGCEKVANLPSRLGYWEGPPFGGGEYHFLYRCKDTGEFNEALKTFAVIRVPKLARRSATSKDGEVTYRPESDGLPVVVHDGPEYSTWFGGRGDKREEKERVDWTFTVWKPANWHRQFNNPKSVFSSDHPNFRQPVPPPQIDVYIGGGGSIVWKKVKVPPNVRVIDKREGASPVKLVGGGLVRGTVYDMATGQPIAGAEIILAKRKDNRDWEEVARGKTDDLGSGEVQKLPAGRYAIRIRAEGYASRSQGTYRNKGKTYHEFVVELLRQASIKGVVTDTDGKPIPGVAVSAQNTLGINGLGYSCSDAKPATTDEQGRFEAASLPQGFTQVRCRVPSLYQTTPIFELFNVPSDDIKIVMTGTGIVRGKVVGPDGKPPAREVHVSIGPSGGNRVGTWGGSMRCKEDGSFEFKGVPPGDYLLSSNPGLMIQGTDPNAKPVTVKAGQAIEVEMTHSTR